MDENLEHFIYLDKLRESGTINMMGAARELQFEFEMDKVEARKIFEWWANQSEVEPERPKIISPLGG
jgi:hypothetical protein